MRRKTRFRLQDENTGSSEGTQATSGTDKSTESTDNSNGSDSTNNNDRTANKTSAVTLKQLLDPKIVGEDSIASFDKFKDVSELAKSYTELSKTLGKKAEDILKEKGFVPPESADKYEFTKNDKIPESKELQNAMKQAFFKVGLSQKQAEEIANTFDAFQLEQVEVFNKLKTANEAKAISELRLEWGKEYEKNLSATENAVKHFGGDKVYNLLKESGLFLEKEFQEMFLSMNKFITPDSIKDSKTTITKANSLESVTEKINKLLKDDKFMASYKDASAHDHYASLNKINALYQEQAKLESSSKI